MSKNKATMKGQLSDTGEEFDLPEPTMPKIVWMNGKFYVHTIENIYKPASFYDVDGDYLLMAGGQRIVNK